MSLIGGDFRKFDLTLGVTDDALAPDRVTSLLGITPTFVSTKGEHRRTKSGRQVIQPTGVWYVRQSVTSAAEATSAIDKFLERLPQAPRVWRQLAQMGRVVLTITPWFSEENASLLMPASLVSRISKMRVSLLIDVWREKPVAQRSKSKVRGK